jgi:hypothetical protein
MMKNKISIEENKENGIRIHEQHFHFSILEIIQINLQLGIL